MKAKEKSSKDEEATKMQGDNQEEEKSDTPQKQMDNKSAAVSVEKVHKAISKKPKPEMPKPMMMPMMPMLMPKLSTHSAYSAHTANSTITLTFGDCAENHIGMQ